MPECVSVEEGRPVWVKVKFCKECKRPRYEPQTCKTAPWYCPLWNEYMRDNDYCSKGA